MYETAKSVRDIITFKKQEHTVGRCINKIEKLSMIDIKKSLIMTNI